MVFSATKASSIEHHQLYSEFIPLSTVTKSAIARRENLDVPTPPKPQKGLKSKCPYCSKFLIKAELKKDRWTTV